jgi:hypothetical protein
MTTYGEIGAPDSKYRARRLEADYADIIRKYEMGFVKVKFEDRIWTTSSIDYCSENPSGIIFSGHFADDNQQCELAIFSFKFDPTAFQMVCRQLLVGVEVPVKVKRSTINANVYFVIGASKVKN